MKAYVAKYGSIEYKGTLETSGVEKSVGANPKFALSYVLDDNNWIRIEDISKKQLRDMIDTMEEFLDG